MFIFIICAQINIAAAEQLVLPVKKEQNLTQIENNIENQQAKKTELNKQRKKLEKSLKKIQSKLIKISSDIRKNEEKLSKTESNLKILQINEKKLILDLEKDYSDIADTIILMHRMQRTPPETIMLRQGGTYQAAQSSLVLQNILPILKEKSDNLALELNRLEKNQVSQNNKRESLKIEKNKLNDKRNELSMYTKQKRSLISSNKAARKKTEKRLRKLSKQAKNMKDLIKKLQEEEKSKRAKRTLKNHKNIFSNFINSNEEGLLPASGVIKISYGDKDEIGADSQGIKIKTIPKALIVSPMDGIVRYTGVFNNYGNIVIIEHADNYHSLIAGLEKIDTLVDQRIKSGEPVGYSRNSNDNSIIYYELRYNGTPVNPNKKIAGLD